MSGAVDFSEPPYDLVSLYLYVACHPGAESALKEELRHKHPELRFSFSRPGFVTFKQTEKPAIKPRAADAPDPVNVAVAKGPIAPRGAKVMIRTPEPSSAPKPKLAEIPIGLDFTLHSIFARQYGLSLDKLKLAPKELLQLPARVTAWAHENEIDVTRVHLWVREPELGATLDSETAEKLRRACAEGLGLKDGQVNECAEVGDIVLDLVAVETPTKREPEKGYEFWIGLHVHETEGPRVRRFPFSGGDSRLVLPENAPSRAWFKCEEAIRFSGAVLETGQTAVEIGSAPGGASAALLERGLKVIGVDPGEMDPRVKAHRNFTHLKVPAGNVHENELPARVDWLFLDMNSEPDLSIGQAEKLYRMRAESIRGLVFTLKLNQWSMVVEMDAWIERITGFAHLLTGGQFSKVVAAHLPHNAQEFCVVALRDGVARRTRIG